MKKFILLGFLAVFGLTSCSEFQLEKSKPSSAQVQRLNGLYIFIYSEPSTDYTVLNRSLEHNALKEIFEQGKGKKIWQALGDISGKAIENVSLRDQLLKMTELAKEKHPEAGALIFHDKIFEAQVIKFD